ncbi:SIS domain-containing protein [Oceaniglobus trochenteri]|uniref:SIS domain-containing protein n=1 Tax=Oceaniglobus trochenteri TaxID=2763260 RepID=UPI001D000994|nr:SIS domain-containing protein [Oceaniglobus trochenteri]
MSGDVTWRELNAQPEAWAKLIRRLEGGDLALPVDLGDFDSIVLLGSGTSYYLALVVADWLRRRGFDARGVPSCEIMLDPWETRKSDARRLAIGFSRSGESTELLLADEILQKAGFTTIGVSCAEGSSLLGQAQHPLLVHEGFENGLIMLQSFTSMILALQWLSGSAEDRAQLRTLPEAGRTLLAERSDVLRDLANRRGFNRFVFLGSGADYPLCAEGALKIQEMSIATSEAYHSLDYRHGPKACADADTAVVLFSLADRDHGRALARDIKALGATVLVIGPDAAGYEGVADATAAIPQALTEGAGAVLSILPAQLFAFATAIRRGKDPDAPVNLAKVVTF